MPIDHPCNVRRGVIGRHRVWPHEDRVGFGRWVLALLLLSRTCAVAVGCGPPDGSQGGHCRSSGCNTYCDAGLDCESNTCVNPFPAPTVPIPCASTDTALCPGVAGTQAYLCTSDASPSPLGFTDCAPEGPLRGETLFCCPPIPGCEATSSCEAASAGFLCTDPAKPEWEAGPSLCAPYTAFGAFTGYCCISEGKCMGAFYGVKCDDSARAAYYCAGSATPAGGDSGVVCTAVDPTDGGDSGLTAYCCH
jgi:hypothetical protein